MPNHKLREGWGQDAFENRPLETKFLLRPAPPPRPPKAVKRLEWASFIPVPWVHVLNDPRQLGCRFGPTGLLGTKDPGEGTGEEGGSG